LDVYDVLQGQRPIFFERNTGREPMQFYMAVAVIRWFDTGLTHYTLKVTNALMGILTVVGVYLLGREIGGRRLAFVAAFFAAVSIWPVATSRVGLRFPFAPAFTSLALWSLLRALRTNRRNDWLIAGLLLGMGLHGYTAFRFMPVAAAVIVVLHLAANWREALTEWARWLGNVTLYVAVSALVFLPLAHYMLDKPQMFWYRSLTRAGGLERAVNGNPWLIFVNTFSRTVGMFNWRGDEVWVSAIRDAPALDVIGGGLFLLGFLYVVFYLGRQRRLLAAQLSIGGIILLLPSMLNLAFPNESPSVVRAGGAIPMAAVLAGLALLYLGDQLQSSLSGAQGKLAAWALVAVLLVSLTATNFQRYFAGYRAQYQAAAMNTREVSDALRNYVISGGDFVYVYHKAYPHWLDSRALALQVAQAPGWETTNVTLQPQVLSRFRLNPVGPTLYLLHPSDVESLNLLQGLYPDGRAQLIPSATPGHNFVFFTVPKRP
jgi:4-amino-4-deoxy-L-arabinose transferase-like glycosyltransferase